MLTTVCVIVLLADARHALKPVESEQCLFVDRS